MTKKLLIIASERISAWVNKGEVVSRYYNPGNLFDEIHLLILNDDKPDPQYLQNMVGEAKLFIYNYPEPDHFFTKTLGWQPIFMKKWANGVLPIVKNIAPSVVRCFGAQLNVFLAALIKKELDIPYVVSLHINPDENLRKHVDSFKQRLIYRCLKKIERLGLKSSNLVMPVYKPIEPYLKDLGITNFEVCYNTVNGRYLKKKTDYRISGIAKGICIGNLSYQKNPINIIKAMDSLDNVTLTIVGQGPYEAMLHQYVREHQLEQKVQFIKRVDNSELCAMMTEYDFVVLHTEHFELSKVMIESFLSGMPVIVNHLKSKLVVPELANEEICLFAKNSPNGYKSEILKLLGDESLRKEMGEKAHSIISPLCDPVACEQKFVGIYKRFLNS